MVIQITNYCILLDSYGRVLMTKEELCQFIIELIEPDTTPDPDNTSDGQLLDIIYNLVKSEKTL